MNSAPLTMKAVTFQPPQHNPQPSKDNPSDIVIQQVPMPEPGPGEVLIRVTAAGINQADIHQRAGGYPPPEGASDIPGLEVSGTIEKVGADAGTWEFGTPVVALLAGGGYAEYVAVDHRQVLPTPRTLTATQAAGVPEVAATCWTNLIMQAATQPGDHVLVYGGAGGIGSFAIQLLNAQGAHPIATAGTPEKIARCLELGATNAINYRTENLIERTAQVTHNHGYDVIFDLVGGGYLDDNVKMLAPAGRMITIGLQTGAKGTLNLARLMAKRAWLTGSTLRSRTSAEKGEVMQQVHENVFPLIDSGQIQASVDRTFPLDEAAAAYEYFAETQRTGKVVLTVED